MHFDTGSANILTPLSPNKVNYFLVILYPTSDSWLCKRSQGNGWQVAKGGSGLGGGRSRGWQRCNWSFCAIHPPLQCLPNCSLPFSSACKIILPKVQATCLAMPMQCHEGVPFANRLHAFTWAMEWHCAGSGISSLYLLLNSRHLSAFSHAMFYHLIAFLLADCI